MLKRYLNHGCLAMLLASLIFTAACGSQGTKLTDADNNGQVTLTVGERLTIELEGNPSTGFNWEVNQLDTTILEQIGVPEFKSASPGLVGSGGTLTLTFKALQPGTTTLVLFYHRSWETDVEPLETFTVQVTVQ